MHVNANFKGAFLGYFVALFNILKTNEKYLQNYSMMFSQPLQIVELQ